MVRPSSATFFSTQTTLFFPVLDLDFLALFGSPDRLLGCPIQLFENATDVDTWKDRDCLRASCGSERQLGVPASIRISLFDRLIAPSKKRSLGQPHAVGYSTFSCFVVSTLIASSTVRVLSVIALE
jgi:hypothetical protein